MSSEADWQELASRGHAVGAIRAYCLATGVGLPEAKAAVERWRAINCPPSPAFQRAFRVARRLTDRLLSYLAGAEPRAVQVRILPDDPKEVVGQNTRFFSELPPERPCLDLAVEVAMEGVTAELARAVAEAHRKDGARLIWVIESQARMARVHDGSRVAELDGSAALEGGAVLPGFACKVSELFG